jgi:hypothetical protein
MAKNVEETTVPLAIKILINHGGNSGEIPAVLFKDLACVDNMAAESI